MFSSDHPKESNGSAMPDLPTAACSPTGMAVLLWSFGKVTTSKVNQEINVVSYRKSSLYNPSKIELFGKVYFIDSCQIFYMPRNKSSKTRKLDDNIIGHG